MKQPRGVTLIELLIVLAVIGILSAIAVPAYREHTLKGRRAAAKAMLYEVLQHSERFYSENNTFTTDMADLGYGDDGPYLSENGSHEIALAAGPTGDLATSVTISATPVDADAMCDVLSLSSNNAKAASGSTPAKCW